ncbi:MAG: hypothetical protein CEO12_415, partial [Parcubacteria group bacterium Gr01-1014_46]
MLKNISNFFNSILDFVLPLRSDFDIVRRLDEEKIYSLPKSEKVENADWITPLFKYKDRKVKAIIWELKYRENTLPLGTIGKMIFDEITAILSDIVLFNADAEFLLVPIPMTDSARADRGYNQSELISRAIVENDTQRVLLYAPQWFRKVKDTPKQSRSESKEERIKNLENCFWADPRVEGKYV